MKIRTTKTTLSTVDIQQIVEKHETDRSYKIRLKEYYAGHHDILHKPERPNDAATNRIVANFCEYITCISTGFFLGQPVAYSSASEHDDAVDMLQDVFKYNDESAHNIELAEEASITGEAYEVLYRIARLGQFGVNGALVLPQFEVMPHDDVMAVVERVPRKYLKVGMDFGFEESYNAVVRMAIDHEKKDLYLYWEYYKNHMTGNLS